MSLDQDTIDKLKKNPHFQKFEKHISRKIGELERFEDMEDIEEMSDKRAGEEIKARKKAVGVLAETLRPFVEEPQRSENNPDAIKKAKDGYGL